MNMRPKRSSPFKVQLHDFWNEQSCDTQQAIAPKYSRAYFDEIEAFRNFDQRFIHSFAQFSRYRGKRVLEVGFGAGTDFIEWLRAGARASGIDLTNEALEHLNRRVELYGLPAPEQLLVGDAEDLPFSDDTFDLGYSFGVLHHTENTVRALRELVRVVRPGGELKVMLYNRRSIHVFNQWVKHAALKGRPERGLSWVVANFIESAGTRAYTRPELASLLPALGLRRIHIHTEITSADVLAASAAPPLNWLYRFAIRVAGERYVWRPEYYVPRVNDPGREQHNAARSDVDGILCSGNPLGFFHCASAEKC